MSRVVETGTSPITPPSSNSCSPTSFFPKSRFRVTTVAEPHRPPTITPPPSVTPSTPPTQPLVSITPTISKNITTSTTLNDPLGVSFKSEPPHKTQSAQNLLSIATNPTGTSSYVHTLSNSFDSPDLEVKRYMDDSCSSISSMDSIDHHHDFNTSMSSMESFDLTLSEPSTKTVGTSTSLQSTTLVSQLKQPEIFIENSSSLPSLFDTINTSGKQIHDSLSSLETSTCSTDSLYGSQDVGAVPILSSNEGTLTNSPTNSSSFTNIYAKDVTLSPAKQDKRIRKTSWINPISMSKGEGTYPATLDKLLSLFQHPGNFFTRSTTTSDLSTTTTTTSNVGGGASMPILTATPQSKKEISPQSQENKPPSRKESPMGGLFAWTSMGKKDAVDEPYVPSSMELCKSIKSPLQQNCSPENTITTTTFVDAPTVIAATVCIPEKLQKEMKENISPDHTVTTVSAMNIKSQTLQSFSPPNTPNNSSTTQSNQPMAYPIEKVRFEVGGDDEDDIINVIDEDDYDVEIDTIEQRKDNSDTAGTSVHHLSTFDNSSQQYPSTSSSNADITTKSGLGQITRDSLSIIKGTSKNSQDSIKSLESLTEIENNVFK